MARRVPEDRQFERALEEHADAQDRRWRQPAMWLIKAQRVSGFALCSYRIVW